MSTDWIHRLIIFIPSDQRELANIVHALYWPERDTEIFTFDVLLSSDGALPTTYYGAYTAATEILWQMWKDLIPIIYPGAIYYRAHFSEEILLETNSLIAQAMIDSPFGWEDALSDMQLKRIQGVA